MKIICFFLLSYLPICSQTQTEDINRVKNNFERCISVYERTERNLKRAEDEYNRLKNIVITLTINTRNEINNEIDLLGNQLSLQKERMDRITGLAEKTRNDIQNISGPTCPSCVISSVNLYCRNADNISSAVSECASKISDISFRLRNSECNDKAGLALINQARLSLKKADSLFALHDTSGADRSYSIYQKLLNMAAEKCGGK